MAMETTTTTVWVVGFLEIGRQSSDSFNGAATAECIGCERLGVEGSPDPNHISTTFAERQNLVRMHMRRFDRARPNAFSKNVENSACTVFTTYYNFVQVHNDGGHEPGDGPWPCRSLSDVGNVVALVEAAEAKRAKCGSYRKRATAA
jgi:hypothetical protein